MAVLNAYAELNLVDPPRGGIMTIVEFTDTRVVATDGYSTDVYFGTGFGRPDGFLTGFETYKGQQLAGEAFDFSLPGYVVDAYVNAGDAVGLMSAILDGTDFITGSLGDDKIRAFDGADIIRDAGGTNYVDGGNGIDTMAYYVTRGEVDLSRAGNVVTVQAYSGAFSDNLVSVERLAFRDGVVAFDEISAQGYRLYQAAFDRLPDDEGVSYWVGQLDAGLPLEQVARSFIASQEFSGLYGSSPSNNEFIDLLYANVLNRDADQSGYAYWNEQMTQGASRADVLIAFSESPENKANVAPQIEDGVWLV